METKTILIVDDALTNRVLLKRYLEDDYNIIEAENGQRAIETESTAASTEEVTASSQELEALMTGVAQSCDEMEQQAEALVNDMSRFVV